MYTIGNEYIHTLDGTIIKHDKWYVNGDMFASRDERTKIDRWCRDAFGAYRHDSELDEGWWLQSEEEYTLFVLTWCGNT